jgi:hypothetical protein
MKVIFLDHDGVICLSNNWGGRMKKQKKYGRKLSQGIGELPLDARFDDFDRKAIEVLNSILEETGAEIVVSSDWKRWASTEELGVYYEQQGIIKKPIDCTPFFKDLYGEDKSYSFYKTKERELRKGKTIRKVNIQFDLDLTLSSFHKVITLDRKVYNSNNNTINYSISGLINFCMYLINGLMGVLLTVALKLISLLNK